ncbi:MAG: carboxypeptidase regulatory-like domain-containing protein, partial [Candidatus Parabeggiatoa sp.]|nr:carboxypeptidase regulatory-like domain-containing protein [Candidatus Parabeggiatoa sp.]
MNSYLRKHDPARQDTQGAPPKRWRNPFAQWVMGGLLAIFILGSVMPTAILAKDDGSVINVMVLYTKYLAEQSLEKDKYQTEAKAKKTIEDIVASTNTTFEESGVKPRLNLVHIEKVDYNKDGNESNWKKPANWDARLSELKKDDDGMLDHIHELRDKHFADVVVLLVYAQNRGYRGTAYQMKTKESAFEMSAFAIVRARGAASNYGFASQLGHLMGCSYDKGYADKLETKGVEDYSFGYKPEGSCTIMAMCSDHLGFWSSPNVKFEFNNEEYATGTDTADCVRTLNDTANIVANFRFADPGVLQFALKSKLQVVDEGVGTVTLEVTRTRGKNGSVSVDIAPGEWDTADVDSDYTFTPATLTWDDGDDSSKTITVTIIDDKEMEEEEILNLELSNLQGGAELGQLKRGRVKINDNDTADIALVIDITSSMEEEIAAVQKALIEYTKRDDVKEKRINFVTFRDDVHDVWGVTDDLDTVRTWIGKLNSAGGEDCPEASLEAVEIAKRNLIDGGKILLVTDAAPHKEDVDDLIAQLTAEGQKELHVKLTDDCGESSSTRNGNRMGERTRREARRASKKSGQELFSRIAFETGGSFVFMPEVNSGSALTAAKLTNSIYNTMVAIDEPVVVDIAPTTFPQGGTLDVIINGSSYTNFNESSSVSVGGNIVVNEIKVLSATQIAANLTVPVGTTPELYNVTVTTSLGTNTETAEGVGLLQVVKPKSYAVVSSVVPYTIVRGTTATFNISGFKTNFDETSTLYFGSGITVQKELTTVHSPTLMTATINISSEADTGLQRLLVRTGSEKAGMVNAFLVLSEAVNNSTVPKITAITPSQGARGSTLDVEISGTSTNFLSEDSFLYFSGTGITLSSIDVKSATRATATIIIDSDVAYGYRNVIVETGDEVAVMLNGFEIAVVPEIQVIPKYGYQGEILGIEIIGQRTHFVADESVVDIKGDKISVKSTTVNSPTQITADIQVDDYAALGWHNVSVTTGSEVVSLHKGFEATPETAPLPSPEEMEEILKGGGSTEPPQEPDAYTASGRIFDENGDPIVGVVVKVGEKTTTTDETGQWKIGGLETGQYTVVAGHKLHTFTPKEVTLGGMESITKVTITLDSGPAEEPDAYTASGGIFDENGDPIAGVVVKVGEKTTTTDEMGQWKIDGLEAGEYTVLAGHKLHTFTSPEVTLGGMEPTKEVKITLDSPDGSGDEDDDYTVYGTITDADGNALAGVNVQV